MSTRSVPLLVGVCFSVFVACTVCASPGVAVLPDENTLAMPEVGWHQMRVLSPTLLELTLINTKASIQAPPSAWNFVGENFALKLPPSPAFQVTANGTPVPVTTVGFKRRPLYAPLKHRDLRIANALYLTLATPLAEHAAVSVKTPDGLTFSATLEPLRYSPVIHVNQTGYSPALPKKARVGYYLGSLGEFPVDPSRGFTVVDASSGVEVFKGTLVARPDQGYNYGVMPYQKVYEADFSDLTTPGQYRLAVPGLGASFPFMIDDGLVAVYARTYALGMYHQRCGAALEMPFTRFTHDPCHTAPATIPTPALTSLQKVLEGDTVDFAKTQAPGTPRMKTVQDCLYPFVNTGTVDVTQGHHDAGDYSKYTINSADFVHFLVLAADVFPGAGALDNFGIPESGDGLSDLLQLAKWESDFLAKMQDRDGGFYFLVYPRDRKYEGDVTPDKGDPQIVLPKTTSVTAAGVAALAQAARSPLFRKQFPSDAARYLTQALKGWDFLEKAWAKHGREGAYQKITHYGNGFGDHDEVAWAATELYLATGEERFHAQLLKEFDPADPKTRQWGWVRLSDSYGQAIRSYAFADRTAIGRPLNAAHLGKCRNELLAAGQDVMTWAKKNAYGTSFPTESKRFRTAAWYFPVPLALDLITAYQLDPKPELLDAAIGNLNFEGGANPNNVTFLTGLGWRRQHEIVHQAAQNDRQVLPPTGIPLGALQGGFAYLDPYKKEIGALTFPFDGDKENPTPFYDRWGDSFNVTTEFVAFEQARGLAWLAWLMAQTPAAHQPWRAAKARITGVPGTAAVGAKVSVGLEVEGIDLAGARIVWEARDQQPAMGSRFVFTPRHSGLQWVEAEAQWPDGRRVFARSRFATNYADGGEPAKPAESAKVFLNFDESQEGPLAGRAGIVVDGTPQVTAENLGWMAKPGGKALRFGSFADGLKIPVSSCPGTNDSIRLKAWLYIDKLPYAKFTGPLFSYAEQGGDKTILGLNFDCWTKFDAPFLVCGGTLMTSSEMAPLIKFDDWQLFELCYKDGTASLRIDGKEVRRFTVVNLKTLTDQRCGLSQFVRVGHWIGYVDDIVLESPATGL